MKRPVSSLLNFSAFSLLLWALYLNFVDLNKTEATSQVKQFTQQQKNKTVVVADTQQKPAGHH